MVAMLVTRGGRAYGMCSDPVAMCYGDRDAFPGLGHWGDVVCQAVRVGSGWCWIVVALG